MATSSLIFSTICQIREKNFFRRCDSKDGDEIHPYCHEYDDISRTIYISAVIRPTCMDKGAEPGLSALNNARMISIRGDVPVQIIDKKLGGVNCIGNYIPIGSEVDITEWKNGIDVIYDHLKMGGNRYARMQFAFEYNNDERNEHIQRTSKLYYHFMLYEDEKSVGVVMEGQIDNVHPLK